MKPSLSIALVAAPFFAFGATAGELSTTVDPVKQAAWEEAHARAYRNRAGGWLAMGQAENAAHWFLTGLLYRELTAFDERAMAMAEQARDIVLIEESSTPEHAYAAKLVAEWERAKP